jgi:hypothetical protein
MGAAQMQIGGSGGTASLVGCACGRCASVRVRARRAGWHLCGRGTMLVCEGSDELVLQQRRACSRVLEGGVSYGGERLARIGIGRAERRIGHHGDAVLLAVGDELGLAEVGMQLDLWVTSGG